MKPVRDDEPSGLFVGWPESNGGLPVAVFCRTTDLFPSIGCALRTPVRSPFTPHNQEPHA